MAPGGGSQEGRGLGEQGAGPEGEEDDGGAVDSTWVAFYKGMEGVTGRVELVARDERSAEEAWERLDVEAILEAIRTAGKDELHLTRVARV